MTSTVRAKMAQQEKEKKVAQRLSETPVEMVRARNEAVLVASFVAVGPLEADPEVEVAASSLAVASSAFALVESGS